MTNPSDPIHVIGVDENGNTRLSTTIYDEGGVPAGVDDVTESLQVISYEHHEIHSGTHYFYKDFYSIAKNGTKEFLVVTPNTTTWGHFIFGVESSTSIVTITIFEDATTSDDGTVEPVRNRNRNNSDNNTVLLYEDPTLTDDGTEIVAGIYGAGKNSSGGQARDDQEIVLKQNTKYLIRITEQNVQATNVNVVFDWYEHANKN